MTTQQLRPTQQVTWQELGAVVAALQLTPSYNEGTGHAFVELNGELLHADLRGVTLTPGLPGAAILQELRTAAYFRQLEAERRDYLARLDPDQRQAALERERRAAELPDPTEHDMERLRERNRLTWRTL